MNSTHPNPQFRTSLLAGILAGVILLGLGAMILAQLLLFPGNDNGNESGSFTNIMTDILADGAIADILIFTVFQAALSTILSLFLGIVLAWSLANRPDLPMRKPLIALISSSLVLPSLVVVLGLVTIYGRAGWLSQISTGLFGVKLPFSIYGLGGILLAHVYFNASYTARIMLHRFEAIPAQTHKLAATLGLGNLARFKIVEFPAIRPALPALAVTVFLLCFTSFAIVLTLGGTPANNTLEVAIYEAIKFDFNLPRAFQLAMVQIFICMFLVVFVSARPNLSLVRSATGSNDRLQYLNSRRTAFAKNVLVAIFAVFFILPLAAIVVDGAGSAFVTLFTNPTFQQAFVTSISIAGFSTFTALTFSLPISSALVTASDSSRLGTTKLARVAKPLLSLAAMMYLVFPALVMAMGFFLLFRTLGGNSTFWAAGVVTLANALIAIPFCVAILRPAIGAAAARNDRLATSLGISMMLRWRLVDWQMLKPDITYAAALAFCFSLGDLGVIALFGNDQFKTLPWLLYQNFGAYRTNDAAAIALVLLIIVVAIFSLAQPKTRVELVR